MAEKAKKPPILDVDGPSEADVKKRWDRKGTKCSTDTDCEKKWEATRQEIVTERSARRSAATNLSKRIGQEAG